VSETGTRNSIARAKPLALCWSPAARPRNPVEHSLVKSIDLFGGDEVWVSQYSEYFPSTLEVNGMVLIPYDLAITACCNLTNSTEHHPWLSNSEIGIAKKGSPEIRHIAKRIACK
jgi:hypothetical protein